MNPFQVMNAMSNPKGFMNSQLQAKFNQMAQQNPHAYQKMQEMISGKSDEQMKQTAMNLAKQQGIDLKQFASTFGINL